MANDLTFARPYAKAAFAYAQEHKAADTWSNALTTLAAIVEVPEMTELLHNPIVSKQFIIDVIKDCVPHLSQALENYLKILAENHRLSLLPAIASLFNEYKAEAERTIDVQVISAFPLDEQQKKLFTEILTQRLKREVNIVASIDPELLGGAIIRAGDEVIDGSARGRLQQLADKL